MRPTTSLILKRKKTTSNRPRAGLQTLSLRVATVVKTKPQQAGRHTLLLTQVTASPETSRWRQFTSLASALDAFITMFEIQYKKMNPTLVRLQYTAKDLNAYVDSLHDCSVMIVNTQHQMYQPRGRDFLKSELTNRLIAMSAKK